MLTSRVRVLRASVLGLLAVMLAGSVVAEAASATAGPFWHHREIGGKSEGSKIEPNAPENFRGEGGVQTIIGKLGGEPIEIAAKSVQIKGALFNGPLQGQAKFQAVYVQPGLLKPELKECAVVIGEDDIVVTHGHLSWKWDGEKKQLEETGHIAQTPGMIVIPAEIPEGASELPKGELTKITLKGTGCGVLGGSFKVEGSETGIPSIPRVEDWSTTLTVRTMEGVLLQHFWNGKVFVGVSIGLSFAGNTASLIGQSTLSTGQQEVAVFEK